MINYPLPKKIADALRKNPQSDNFGLLFSRLQQVKDEKRKKDDKEKYKIWEKLVEESQRIYSRQQGGRAGMSQFLTGLHKRLDKLESGYTKIGFKRFDPAFEIKVDWRLVIGLGNPSVLDTGLRLHSIYGFPYLPGQGLKGAVRQTWMAESAEYLGIARFTPNQIQARQEKNKRENKTEKTPWGKFEHLLISAKEKDSSSENTLNSLKDDTAIIDNAETQVIAEIKNIGFTEFFSKYVLRYQELFGGANGQGKVNFLDVLPTELILKEESINKKEIMYKSILEADIINPHYGEYYTTQGETPPADYLSPKPIFFLAFRCNTPFRFRVLAKDDVLLNEVEKLITVTASDYGFGAKTMSGYGEMYLNNEEKEKV